MNKSTVIAKKKRGPAPTGKGEPVVVRMQPPMLAVLDAWIAKQKQPFPSRPEAVRRLVEQGLAKSSPADRLKAAHKTASVSTAVKAKELAAKAIDRLIDKSAPAEEQASRKRRLLKGPEEFRDLRLDRAKKK